MSQRTRLKKMSLGAALILGTVSVSNFAEADENTSNSFEGSSSSPLTSGSTTVLSSTSQQTTDLSGTNEVAVNSGPDEEGNKTPDVSTPDVPPVSTNSPETVGDNSRTPGNPFKYDSTRTFGQWIEDLASYFKIKLNAPKEISNSTRTYKDWASDFVKVVEGNLGPEFGSEVSKYLAKENPKLSDLVEKEIKQSDPSETGSDNSSNKTDVEENQKALDTQAAKEAADVANQKALDTQAANEAADVANQKALIQKAANEAADVANQKALIQKAAKEAADVANQKALIQKAAKEAADVAKENSLRPSSLKAELNAAAKDLSQGKTSKADDFYEKSSEVIKKYYEGTDEEKATLKKLGYTDSNIEYLSNHNKDVLRKIQSVQSEKENEEKNKKNESKNSQNEDSPPDLVDGE